MKNSKKVYLKKCDRALEELKEKGFDDLKINTALYKFLRQIGMRPKYMAYMNTFEVTISVFIFFIIASPIFFHYSQFGELISMLIWMFFALFSSVVVSRFVDKFQRDQNLTKWVDL